MSFLHLYNFQSNDQSISQSTLFWEPKLTTRVIYRASFYPMFNTWVSLKAYVNHRVYSYSVMRNNGWRGHEDRLRLWLFFYLILYCFYLEVWWRTAAFLMFKMAQIFVKNIKFWDCDEYGKEAQYSHKLTPVACLEFTFLISYLVCCFSPTEMINLQSFIDKGNLRFPIIMYYLDFLGSQLRHFEIHSSLKVKGSIENSNHPLTLIWFCKNTCKI